MKKQRVTFTLREPLLTSVETVAEAGGITVAEACLVIMDRAIKDALRPMQGKAVALAHEIAGTGSDEN
jgi:hypothetical protein